MFPPSPAGATAARCSVPLQRAPDEVLVLVIDVLSSFWVHLMFSHYLHDVGMLAGLPEYLMIEGNRVDVTVRLRRKPFLVATALEGHLFLLCSLLLLASAIGLSERVRSSARSAYVL